ncbi:MAG: hypothetical protein Q7U53_17465 [Anaerolineaceae bacterium]|nr:hypothetical protein [Anaerolineaceae bacterium]
MARSRGGQPGNANAVKHGFYSRKFRDLESQDLETALRDGLGDEIALMRVMIRRVFDYANDNAGDLEGWTGTLSALGAASTRLAGMLRTQKLLGGNNSDALDALSKALAEVTSEFGCK